MGLSGRVPHRVDAVTKAGLLDLLDEAVDAGWPLRRACHELELGEVRAHRWLAQRTRAVVDDRVLDTANKVAAGGLLVAVGALLPAAAAVAAFFLVYLAIVLLVLTLLRLAL